MSQNEITTLLQKISEDVAMMKSFVRLMVAEVSLTSLRKVASTSERQQMWRLADGNRSNEEIAKMVGVALRSVQYFVQDAQDAGLILMKKRGYPSRTLDVFPSEWRPWKPKSEVAQQQDVGQNSAIKEGESSVQG